MSREGKSIFGIDETGRSSPTVQTFNRLGADTRKENNRSAYTANQGLLEAAIKNRNAQNFRRQH